MEAANQKDINQTFIKFLAIFLATVGLIVAAVYFDAFIPKKQLIKLKKEQEYFNTEKEYQVYFKGRLAEINKYLSTIDSVGSNGYNFDYLIGLKIAEMNQEIENRKRIVLANTDMNDAEKGKDTLRLGMYLEMVQSLRILHRSQLENVSIKRTVKPMEEYKSANAKYQQEYDRIQGELTRCQGLVSDLYKKTAK